MMTMYLPILAGCFVMLAVVSFYYITTLLSRLDLQIKENVDLQATIKHFQKKSDDFEFRFNVAAEETVALKGKLYDIDTIIHPKQADFIHDFK